MLTVNDEPADACWLDYDLAAKPPVRFLMAPAGLAEKARARREASQAYLADGPDAGGVEYSLSLIRSCLKAWEGIGDRDGQPIEVTTETVNRLMAQHEAVFDYLDRVFCTPILTKAAEKNGSSLSLRGGSGAKTPATATAKAAARKTPAKPSRPKASKPARTGATRRGRSRAKASGTS